MKALVYGGSGALGRSLVSKFINTWKVTSIDFIENNQTNNNIILDKSLQPNEMISLIKDNLGNGCQHLLNIDKYDCIVCAAGGWTGGSIKDENFLEVYQEMHDKNLVPALISCHLATKFLNKEGLIVLTGASAVFSGPTPTMIGYALAKTGVHALAMNMFGSVMPQNGAIITILPETLDTPANRQAMPTADYKTWADPDQISGLIRSWAEGLNRPISGSMVHLRVKGGMVVPEFV